MSNCTETLNARLKYQGGNAEGRFIQDKLTSLKRALLYSYQACTAVFNFESEEPREFRCLMNPDKLKPDYDIKTLSIPYHDIQLNKGFKPEIENGGNHQPPATTSDGLEEVGQISESGKVELKPGMLFKWKETDTVWLIVLHNKEEDAYFRAETRRCDQHWREKGHRNDPGEWCYVRGPIETTQQWNQKGGIEWNNMNYSLIMFVPKTEKNLKLFHRFTKIEVEENTIDELDNRETIWRPWEVSAVDPYYYDGIIQVMLDEAKKNTIEDAVNEERESNPKEEVEDISEIKGSAAVEGFSIYNYTISAQEGGIWKTDLPNIKIVKQSSDSATIEVATGKPGEFKLFYVVNKCVKAYKTIKILPM